MLTKPRTAIALPLLLVASLVGCTGLPTLMGRKDPPATASVAQGDLVITTQVADALATQALGDYLVTLKVDFPVSQRASIVRTVAPGTTTEFTGLLPERVHVTASATAADSTLVLASTEFDVELLPGKKTPSDFTLFIGGSSALDTAIDFRIKSKDFRSITASDNFSSDFAQMWQHADATPSAMALFKDEATSSVTFSFTSGGVNRQFGSLPSVSLPWDWWFGVPDHAVYVDSRPLGTHSKVRHFRWDNVFRLKGTDRTLTVDRWEGAPEGLIKETLTEAGQTISLLELRDLLPGAAAPMSGLATASTYAGRVPQTSSTGFSVGGGFADGASESAMFNEPLSLAVDSNGRVYVADSRNNRIREIDSDGTVTTLAGQAQAGSTDADGVAASFNNPTAVAVDTAGNAYVADSRNNLIRKITPGGTVSTLAGQTTSGFVDAKGAHAMFSHPHGIAVSSDGTVFVADSNNQRIRKILVDGTVSTLAGQTATGSLDGLGTVASFWDPTGLALDDQGNLYVADTSNHEIRKVTSVGQVTTLAGQPTAGYTDGATSSALFNYPKAVAVGAQGTVYVADTSNNVIRTISGSTVATFAGIPIAGFDDGPSLVARFFGPAGLALGASGQLYVADRYNHLVRVIR